MGLDFRYAGQILAILAFGASCGASAQAIDQSWIVERVVAGKFDELRAVKAESDKGSPVAQYWWGMFLDNCLYGACDPDAARVLWSQAAKAGNSNAKLALLGTVTNPEALDALFDAYGAPANLEEKLGYAYVMATLSIGGGTKNARAWEKAQAVLRELASDRRLAAIFAVGGMNGFRPYAAELRAMVEAGFSSASEKYLQWLLLSENSRHPQLLARARAGDHAVGAALCESARINMGYEQLPAELLTVCEQSVLQGYAGVLPALLVHHHKSGNARAAAAYAGLCAAHVPLKCASDLADYYYDTSGKSPAWELWDVVAVAGAMPAGEMHKPPALLRQAFSIHVRTQQLERHCVLRRYDPAAGKFEDEPRCSWRRPLSVPAEFLSR